MAAPSAESAGESAADSWLGAILADKYQILAVLGQGAMGRVYRARHLQMGGFVALKLMAPEIASEDATVRRFRKEAQIASRLRHPNSVRIYDFGETQDGTLYLVMELLEGVPLHELLKKEGPLPPFRLVSLLSPALLALSEAHQENIIHRDFKPENLFVETLRSGEEIVKVLDFGIAKVKGLGDSNLTHAGSVCGTPDYMSPEQVRGSELDARSDVYAAGVVLYEMLTCTRPFSGSLLEVMTLQLGREPEPPSRRRPDLMIPPKLEQICLKAMSKRREERFASALEMERALWEALPKEAGAPLSFAQSRPNRPNHPSPPGPIGPNELVVSAARQRDKVLLQGKAGQKRTELVKLWAKEVALPALQVHPDPTRAKRPLWPIREAVRVILNLDPEKLAPGPQALSLLEEALRTPTEDPGRKATRLDLPGLMELFFGGGQRSGLGSGMGPSYDVRRRECLAACVQTLRSAHRALVFEGVDSYDAPSKEVLGRLLADPGNAVLLLSCRENPFSQEVTHRARSIVCEGSPSAESAHADRLADRLAQLPRGAFAVVASLAVFGTSAPEGAVFEVARTLEPGLGRSSGSQREDLLDLLQTEGFLLRGPGALLALRESPELPEVAQLEGLADLVYRLLPKDKRLLLHQGWYRFAQREEGGPVDPILVCHHGVRASIQALPAPLLTQAGDAARCGFDDGAAESWYRLAFAADRSVPSGLRLALVLRYTGRIVESEQTLRQILALGKGDARVEADARRGLSRLANVWEQKAAAQLELHAALRAAWQVGDPDLILDLYLELGDLMARTGDLRAAERELKEAIDLVTLDVGTDDKGGKDPDRGRPANLYRLFLRLGELYLEEEATGKERTRAALELGHRALSLCRKSGDSEGQGKALRFLGVVYQLRGESQLAATYNEAALAEARRLGDRRAAAEVLLALADAARRDATDAAKESVRLLLSEASSLSSQIDWSEGMRLVEERRRELAWATQSAPRSA